MEHGQHPSSHHHSKQTYTCPMHPEVIKPGPGKCPKCGMDLVPVGETENKEDQDHADDQAHKHGENKEQHKHENHTGHDKHAGHHMHDFLKLFWICLIITIPVLLLSHMIQQWLGFEIKFTGDKYLLLLLSAFIYFYGGMPFLKGMVSEIKDKAIG